MFSDLEIELDSLVVFSTLYSEVPLSEAFAITIIGKLTNKFIMNMLIPSTKTISELRFAVIRVANKRIALTKI